LVVLEVVFHQVELADDEHAMLSPVLTHVYHSVAENVDGEHLAVVAVVFPVSDAEAAALDNRNTDAVALAV